MEKNREKELSNLPPAGEMTRLYMTRLGVILSNISIVCLVICFFSVVSVIAYGLMFVLGLALIVLTLGIIFVVIPDYWNKLLASGEVFGKLAEAVFAAAPYLAGIGIACAAASIVLLLTDKHRSHTGRIVISSVILIIIVLFVAVLIAGVFKK